MLTVPFRNRSLEETIRFAAANGLDALEVMATPGSPHIDPSRFSEADAELVQRLLDETGVRISALACYMNLLEPAPENRENAARHFRDAIDTAALLGVGVVCTLAGMPMPGKSKAETIREDIPGVFAPLADYAAGKNIRIAFENWYATNIQHLEHWRLLFEVLPAENVGLNFDPSHLYWQQIDYLAAVEEFRERIFHTHAKDCEVRTDVLRRVGVLERGWWRYVIPGFGGIAWGPFIGALRRIKYDGVLSIEHEDGAFSPDDGFIRGARYLRNFI